MLLHEIAAPKIAGAHPERIGQRRLGGVGGDHEPVARWSFDRAGAAGIGRAQTTFAGATTDAIVVVNPEPLSMADAYASLKVLSIEQGVRHAFVVPNKTSTRAQADEVVNRLRSIVDRFLTLELTALPPIPADHAVAEAAQEVPEELNRWAERLMEQVFERCQELECLFPWARELRQGPPPGVDRVKGGVDLVAALVTPASPAEVHARRDELLADLGRAEADELTPEGKERWRALADVMLPQLLPTLVASFCLVAAVVFGAYGTALALVGTRLSILPLQLYSMIAETGSDFPAAAALSIVLTGCCTAIMAAGELVAARHEPRDA